MQKKSATKIKNAPYVRSIIALTIVAVLLLGVVAASVLTYGFTAADPYYLFSKQPSAAPDNSQPGTDEPGIVQPAPDTPDDVYVLRPISTQQVKLTAMPFTAPMPDGMESHIVRLVATVTPENAEDKSMDWTVEFANPSSAWASGKTVTDYVTVNPTTDGALTADVTGLKAFGEQIIVKCTSRVNPEAMATCTVDYIVRYSIDSSSVQVSAPAQAQAAQVTCTLSHTDGTIEPTNQVDYDFGFTASAYQQYKSIFGAHSFADGDLLTETLSNTTNADVLGMSYTFTLPLIDNSFESVYGKYSTQTKEEFYKKFFPAATAKTVATTPAKQNNANAAIREWIDWIITQSSGESFSVWQLNITLNSKNTDHEYTKTSTAHIAIEGYSTQDGAAAYVNRLNEIKSSILDAVSGVEVSQGSIVF